MYHVEIAGSNSYIFTVKSKNYEFRVDMNGNEGITPPDTLLASLGTCIGVYIRKYCEGTKCDIKDFTVTLDAELSKENPVRFKEIGVEINLKGIKIDDMRKNSMLRFIKNCPVHRTLEAHPIISVTLK